MFRFLLIPLLLFLTQAVSGQHAASGSTIAEEMIERSEQKIRTAQTVPARIHAYYNVAFTNGLMGRVDVAEVYYDSALNYAEIQGYHALDWMLYNGLSHAYQTAGRLPEALRTSRKGLSVMIDTTDAYMASLFTDHAVVLSSYGLVHAAMDTLVLANQLLEGEEDHHAEGRLKLTMAGVLNEMGDSLRYVDLAMEGIRLMDKVSPPRILAKELCLVSDGLLHAGRLDEADELINRADSICAAGQFRNMMIRVLEGHAHLAQKRGQHEGAVQAADKALTLAKELDFHNNTSNIARIQARSYEQLGNLHAAIAVLEFALSKQTVNQISHRHHIHKQLATLYKRVNDEGNSLRSLENFVRMKEQYDRKMQLRQSRNIEARYRHEQQKAEILELDNELLRTDARANSEANKRRLLTYGLVGCGILLILAIALFRAREKTRSANERTSVVSAMLTGEEQERERIAKELHDGLNGTLATVKMYMDNLQEGTPDLAANERYHEARALLKGTTEEVRRISHDLMPLSLQREGLSKALERVCQNLSDTGVLDARFMSQGLETRLPERFELTIYRIVQELIQNVIKHAEASSITLQLFRIKNELQVTLEDDGEGFAPNASESGIGLSNIRSRVSLLSGESQIDSRPGEGTSVFMVFDLSKQQKEL